MKRLLIIIVTIISLCIPVYAEENNDSSISKYGENLLDYIQGDSRKLLLTRKNYGYMTFVEEFESNAFSMYLIEIADKLIGLGSTPSKEKCMEVLINIIGAYDMDQAENIANQQKMDNLKSIKDYAMDFTKMGNDMVSVMTGTSSSTSELEEFISIAIDSISTLSENTNNWIEALSNLETIIQDYSAHDNFLKIIANNSDGELKEAAQTLRDGLTKVIKIKLDTYQNISDENFHNYEEFIFSNNFFTIAKQFPEYDDDAYKFFIDFGDNIVSTRDTFKSSWELGEAIGKLVGNIVVSAEDLINRVLEMMVIYDVSVILQNNILDIETNFFKNIGTSSEIDCINDYINISQYLIGCRIRGEYCIYSIVARDAGLLKWFNKSSAEKAEKWYKDKTSKIIDLQNALLNIKTIEIILEISDYLDDLELMKKNIGGNNSSETGDHEEWIIADDIQYGNYINSSKVDEVSIDSSNYIIFGLSVGMSTTEATTILTDNGWEHLENNKYQKKDMNIFFQEDNNVIQGISFYRNCQIQESTVKNECESKITKEEAIELAKQKMGDDFGYVYSQMIEFRGINYFMILVKGRVDVEGAPVTTLTKIFVSEDGTCIKEGMEYMRNGGIEIEFYE